MGKQTDHMSRQIIHSSSSVKTDNRDSLSGQMIHLFTRIYTQMN